MPLSGEKPIALIDLDGTVADYHEACIEGLQKLQRPGEEFIDPWSIPEDIRPAWLSARRDLVSNQPGFWRNLKVIRDGYMVVDQLEKAGFELMVLTKGPVRKTAAWTEKADWCSVNLPGRAVTITHDKSIVYGKVLFDDYPHYVVPWLEHRPRGLVLMLDQPWNRSFEHPQVKKIKRGINYLESEVLEALMKIRDDFHERVAAES